MPIQNIQDAVNDCHYSLSVYLEQSKALLKTTTPKQVEAFICSKIKKPDENKHIVPYTWTNNEILLPIKDFMEILLKILLPPNKDGSNEKEVQSERLLLEWYCMLLLKKALDNENKASFSLFAFNHLTAHRILLSLSILGNKFIFDHFLNNNAVARRTGVHLTDLNRAEIDMAFALGFNASADFETPIEEVCSFFSELSCDNWDPRLLSEIKKPLASSSRFFAPAEQAASQVHPAIEPVPPHPNA